VDVHEGISWETCCGFYIVAVHIKRFNLVASLIFAPNMTAVTPRNFPFVILMLLTGYP
jgi:hypothetical protein